MSEKLFIAFRVNGEAQPAGSKTAYPVINKKTGKEVRGPTGRIVINMVDACKYSDKWKKYVGEIARIEMKSQGIRHPATGPLRLICRFYQLRPKIHYRTGKFSDILKDDAPVYPISKPDATKLLRAVEDGMNEVVYLDDATIVSQVVTKRYGKLACVDIEVWKIEGDKA